MASTLTLSRSPGGFFMEYHPKLRPVDSPTDGVFLAGAAQGPKDIPASVAQGSARRLARGARALLRHLGDRADRGPASGAERCISAQGKKCGICAPACPYGAITVEAGPAGGRHPGQVPRLRRLRGRVPAQRHHPGSLYRCADRGAARTRCWRDKPEEKILAFMCHWCSYGGADNAGTSHFEYPATSRGIRVMCSARMDQDFILEAFRRGAGMVLVSGCHPQDCHYITGQQVAAKRFDRMPRTLERMGINPERFRVEWISAAEGEKYARVITEMDAKLESLDKEQLLRRERARRAAEIAKRLARWKASPQMAELMAWREPERRCWR